jgi:hypothetical protein
VWYIHVVHTAVQVVGIDSLVHVHVEGTGSSSSRR